AGGGCNASAADASGQTASKCAAAESPPLLFVRGRTCAARPASQGPATISGGKAPSVDHHLAGARLAGARVPGVVHAGQPGAARDVLRTPGADDSAASAAASSAATVVVAVTGATVVPMAVPDGVAVPQVRRHRGHAH